MDVHGSWTSDLTQERLDAVTKWHNDNWAREQKAKETAWFMEEEV